MPCHVVLRALEIMPLNNTKPPYGLKLPILPFYVLIFCSLFVYTATKSKATQQQQVMPSNDTKRNPHPMLPFSFCSVPKERHKNTTAVAAVVLPRRSFTVSERCHSTGVHYKLHYTPIPTDSPRP